MTDQDNQMNAQAVPVTASTETATTPTTPMAPPSAAATPPATPQPPVAPAPVLAKPASEGTPTSHTVVTILLLLFFPLLGIILMWVWTKWSKVVKWVITILFIVGQILVLLFFSILSAAILSAVNPAAQIEKANMIKEAGGYDEYMQEQFANEGTMMNSEAGSASDEGMTTEPPMMDER